MSFKESNMLSLGTKAPAFKLLDTVSNKTLSLENLKSDVATVIMFSCNHCPYVIHVNETVVNLAKEFEAKGVKFIAISSNDVENYPQDAPDKMTLLAKEAGYTFPYLYDETQEVAKAYDAACTPDFYLFDGNMELAYRGRLDGSTPGNNQPLTGDDLRNAINAVLNKKPIAEPQLPSGGCNIKWKA